MTMTIADGSIDSRLLPVSATVAQEEQNSHTAKTTGKSVQQKATAKKCRLKKLFQNIFFSKRPLPLKIVLLSPQPTSAVIMQYGMTNQLCSCHAKQERRCCLPGDIFFYY